MSEAVEIARGSGTSGLAEAGPLPIRPAEAKPLDVRTDRLVSLDVFRGVTIAGMLLVNNPGSWSHIYGPLRHAPWHGWTPTDLIFPFFLFIVGVAIALSFGTLSARGATRPQLFAKVARRTLIIFGLGLVLHGFPSYDLGHIRIPGVLQRIAVCYFFASVIVLAVSSWRGRALAGAALLLLYWALVTLVPVPGMGAGVLEAGRDLGAYLDRLLLGTNHLWASSKTWDPEGILSTMPAVATVVAGVLTGEWLRTRRTPVEKTVGLFVAGNALLLLGVIWDAAFPINKNLWTSSYVVFTAGMALQFLGMCYWLVDVKGYRRWAQPCVVYGVNAIAAFFLSSLLARILGLVKVGGPEPVSLKTYLYEHVYASWLSPINASLAFAMTYVLFWLGAMWLLYRRRIFIKI